MATYSYTTTAAEEAGLTEVVAGVNAQRAAQSPPLPALTNGQYLLSILQSAFASYQQQKAARVATDLKTNYQNASAATQAQVQALLGVTP